MSDRPFTANDLQEILTAHAGFEDPLPADLSTTYEEMGLDSLGAVAVVQGIEQRLGIAVSATDARDLISPASVLAYVNDRLARPAGV
jgi:acyl carrier protein